MCTAVRRARAILKVERASEEKCMADWRRKIAKDSGFVDGFDIVSGLSWDSRMEV